MKGKRLAVAVVVIGISLLIGGCYEGPAVTIHEAGVYKGKPDHHETSNENRWDILRKRFWMVQSDR